MTKIEEAQDILKQLGLPPSQCNTMSALTLLALCGIGDNGDWRKATRSSLGLTKGIMNFISVEYNITYAANTRETFRRQVLHQFVQARIVDYNPDYPNLPVNSPRAHYAISNEALKVIAVYGTNKWQPMLNHFLSKVGTLKAAYIKERTLTQVPVKLSNGKILKLSSGKHNLVQAAIVEQFAPRFAQNGVVLYLGDTAKKDLYIDKAALKALNIPIDQHSKLPDVIIYDEKRKWLFLIEAVTSHGPISPKRIIELEKLLENCKSGKVYVTAFPNYSEFKRHISDIAWETEVWLMELPDHMIHFNGDRFMGPR